MSHWGDTLFQELGEHVADATKKYHVPDVAVGVQHEGNEYAAGPG
jgi:hypothetical protein